MTQLRAWFGLPVAILAALALAGGASAAGASPSPLDFGSVAVGSPVTLTDTITVDAGFKVGLVSGSGTSTPFSFDGGTCTGSTSGFVGPGTCTINETLQPTGTGPIGGSLEIDECPTTGTSPCIPVTISLTATGTPAALANPATLDFGSVAVGNPKTLPDTITVDPGYKIGLVSGSGTTAPFSFSGGTCTGGTSGFVGPGTCTINEAVQPTGAGPISGSLEIDECPTTGSSPCIPVTIALTGTAALSAAANPSTLDFGAVAVNTPKTLTSTLTLDVGYSFGGATGVSGLNPPFGFSSGTCSGAVGPATCTVRETFMPTTTNPATGTVSPFECPTVGGQCIGIPIALQGTGQLAAAASPATLDFGTVAVNTPKTLTSTLTIDAGYSFGGATGVSGLNPPFGFSSGTCSGAVGPATCTVQETFTPTTTTPATGTVNPFECPTAGGQCIGIPIALQGTGQLVAAANPATLDFGSVIVGGSKTLTSTLTIDAGYSFGGATGVSGLNPPFGFSSGTCSGVAGPATCTVRETFTPTTTTPATGTVNPFECPTGGGQCIGIPIALQGTGALPTPPDPATLDFGNVTLGSSKTLTSTLTLDAGYSFGGATGVSGLNPPFGFSSGTCSGVVGPAACTVQETFTPTTTTPATGSVNPFECPTAGGQCIGLPIALQGTGQPGASANPAILDFGSVLVGGSKTLTSTLTIDPGYSFGGATGVSGLNPPFGFNSGTCSGVAGPATCTVRETFTPTTTDPATGTVNPFECPTAGGQCIGIPIALQGTGALPTPPEPATLDFGNVTLGSSKTLTSTLTIDAGYSFGGATGISGLNPPFSFSSGTCSGVVGPATCTVQETFTPTTTTPATGSVNPFECPTAGGQCIGLPIALQGTGQSGASANPSTLDFGTVPVNTPKTLTSTLTIDAGYSFGGATGISGLNPPFSFSSGTCSGVVGPATCTVQETFTPTTTNPATGTVDPFECPTAGGQCIGIPIALQGTGQLTAAANPATLDFGTVPVNTPKTLTSTLTLDAGYSFGGATGISGLNPPFSFSSGTCSGVVGPATCTIQETFTPSDTNPATGTVNPFECPTVGGQCIGIPLALLGTGVQVATTAASTSSTNPSLVGQSVTFTATLGGTLAARAPTGTVTFVDGSTTLGTVPLSGITASFTTSTLAAGPHTITATYSGDAAYKPSSATITQTVQRLASTTNLLSFPDPSIATQTVLLIATVSGAGNPTGTVTYMDGSTTLGTATLVNGRATLSVSTLPAGVDQITATYSGDATFAGSTGSRTQFVLPILTFTHVDSSRDPSTVGQPVTFTVTIARVFGSTPVTGTVTFSDNGTVLGTVQVSGGRASFTTSSLGGGAHSITAAYSGDSFYTPSSDRTVQEVRRIDTSTALKSSQNPSTTGQAVTFTATVAASHGTPTPTGTVTFTDGHQTLGTVTLNAAGQATLTTSSLAQGTHAITASYSGSATDDDSADSVNLTVQSARSRH